MTKTEFNNHAFKKHEIIIYCKRKYYLKAVDFENMDLGISDSKTSLYVSWVSYEHCKFE